jgi:hypothetical protein
VNWVGTSRSQGDLAGVARLGLIRMNTEPRLKWPRFVYLVAGPGLARPLGPRTKGGLAIRASLLQPQAGGNQRPPGYEPSSYRGSIRRQFHPFEGAPYGSAGVSPARFAPENMP